MFWPRSIFVAVSIQDLYPVKYVLKRACFQDFSSLTFPLLGGQ